MQTLLADPGSTERTRVRRIPELEAKILAAESPDWKALGSLSLHAARLKRQFSASLKEFQQMHTANTKLRDAELKDAITVHKADEILERESTVAEFGFDFTLDELDQAITRDEALEDAKDVVCERYYESAVDGLYDDDEDDDDLDAAA